MTIIAAIAGASIVSSLSPYLHIPQKQIADLAIEAVEAGATEITPTTIAIHLGKHARVRLGDNIYIKEGVLGKTNAQLVEKVVQFAEILNVGLATSDVA